MFPYYGAKSKIAPWIFQNFDLQGINNYVEPFSGSFKVYLHPKNDFSSVKNVVYNDIYLPNCNVFTCAQDPHEFQKTVFEAFMEGGLLFCKGKGSYDDIYANYKDFFYNYKKDIKPLDNPTLGDSDYEAALIYLFLVYSAFNAKHFKKAGYKERNKYTTTARRFKMLTPLWNNLRDDKLMDKIARINKISADDFTVVMKDYNSPDTFLYLDPPYVGREKKYDYENTGVFTENHHKILADLVKESNAKICISYYPSPKIDEYYPKPRFRYESKKVRDSSSGKIEDEILIMNYPKILDEK